jgi:hypothetical protein
VRTIAITAGEVDESLEVAEMAIVGIEPILAKGEVPELDAPPQLFTVPCVIESGRLFRP